MYLSLSFCTCHSFYAFCSSSSTNLSTSSLWCSDSHLSSLLLYVYVFTRAFVHCLKTTDIYDFEPYLFIVDIVHGGCNSPVVFRPITSSCVCLLFVSGPLRHQRSGPPAYYQFVLLCFGCFYINISVLQVSSVFVALVGLIAVKLILSVVGSTLINSYIRIIMSMICRYLSFLLSLVPSAT